MPKRKGGWYGESQRHSEARKKGSSPRGAPTQPTGDGTRFMQRVKDKDIQAEQQRIDELQKQGLNPDVKKPLPHGKNVILYHRTTPERADAIVKEGFRSDKGASTVAGATSEKGNAFFVPHQSVENWRGYGEAVVAVTVPYKDVQKDETMSTYYPPPTKVEVKKLKGRRFKRVT